MPQVTQGAIATVSSNLRNQGGANILASISSNDGDTSYGASLVGETRSGTFDPSQLPAEAAYITSATNANLSKEDGPGGDKVTQNWDGAAWNAGIGMTSGYGYNSDAHNSARLTVAYMNTDWLGVRMPAGTSRGTRTTYIRRITNYGLGGGGGAFILVEILLPVLGSIAGLTREMMPALAAEVHRLDTRWRHIIHPHEHDEQFRWWKAYACPAHFDLGGAS